MLEEFLNDENFLQQTVYIYNYSSTLDISTGVMTKGYKLQEKRDVWIFSKSIAKSLFTDKVIDSLDAMLITDKVLHSSDVIKYSNNWYSCNLSDDILSSAEVVEIGLVKIDQPDIVDVLPARPMLLGDSLEGFVLGDFAGAIW